jgi:predicted nucleotidyltransferase/uncharacterized protein (DUF433 family)
MREGETITMNVDQYELILSPILGHQLDLEEYLIETDSYGEPVLAQTGVTVEEILSKMAAGWFLGDIMKVYQFSTDKPIMAAVAYAESLPPRHCLATKLHQYREQLKQKVRGILTELRQRLKMLYGERLVQVVLFGSQARCDANPGSDIDVLVVLEGAVNSEDDNLLPSELLAELSLRYSEVINCIFMSDFDFQYSQEPLLRNVRREGVVI